ncbi:TIGR02680 family protein [Paenibacillus sp. GSMTC-2017]|uniref:TIGR02680 family protein n=1 Tax=Paenibacillus sp. GSMTC-2017 TaxID=2794350 RepID=UPI0018D8CAC6|nr:TIGR02680 family protein [Paenibacillus sp. GSMTC-2017]MBH5319028.1 TIGR02680 family protein [Paenibacillus sp. GSMTC-2017]
MTNHARRWKPHRVILFNYWYFNYEEYYFKNGRLLLRGHNGAGKSIAMNTLFTFMLDGNKDPKRLDPFESSDRKFYDILLGEESLNKDIIERIGYVVIEYKLTNTEQYITTGFGLHSKRKNRRLEDAWGFVIHDRSRRIGRGTNPISLYKVEVLDGSPEQIPLNRKEITAVIRESGTVVDSKEYAELINKQLFKFPDVTGLKLFTDVLVRLKSPKLTKGGGPDDLKETLNESLPPLSDQELSALTTTVEAQDQTQREILKTQSDLGFATKLDKGYDDYISYVFAEKAKYYLESNNTWNAIALEHQTVLSDIETKSVDYNETEQKIRNIEHEIEGLKQARQELGHDKIVNLDDTLQSAKRELTRISNEKSDQTDRYDLKKASLTDANNERRNIENELWVIEKELKAALESLEELGMDSAFEDIYLAFSDHFKRNEKIENYNFSNWESNIRIRLQRLGVLLKKINELDQKKRDLDGMRQQIEEKQGVLEIEREKRMNLANIYDMDRNNAYAELENWINELTALVLSANSSTSVKRMINGYLENVTEEQLIWPITREREEQVSQCLMEQALVDAKMQSKIEKRKLTKEELCFLEGADEIEPELPISKENQIREFKERGIPCAPFYAVVDFKGNLTEEQKSRLESVLTETGVLTSLIVPNNRYNESLSGTVLSAHQAKASNNLTKYLDVSAAGDVSHDDVLAVLQGISVSVEDAYFVTAEGSFKGSFTAGTASQYGVAKYIGKHAREQERLRKIAVLKEKVAALEFEIEELEVLFNESKVRQWQIEVEYQSFPKFSPLKDAKQQFESVAKRITELLEPELMSLNEKFKELKTNVEKQSRNLNAEFEDIAIEKNVQVVNGTCEGLLNFERALSNLKITYRSREDKQILLKNQDDKIDTIKDGVNDAKAAVLSLDGQIKKINVRIENYKKQLEDIDADNIRELAKSINDKLEQLPKDQRELDGQLSELKNNLKNLRNRLPVGAQKEHFMKELVLAWESAFLQDAKEFSEKFGLETESDTKLLAESVKAKFGQLLAKKDRTKNKSELGNVFSDADKGLPEYNLTMEPMEFEFEFSYMAIEDEIRVEMLKTIARREKITLEYQSRRVSPSFAKTKLTEQDQMLAEVMAEKDREIYEDILINHVGDTVKNKIRNAKEWVIRINTIMEKTQNSSGLKFEVEWSPKRTDNEQELDTIELMRFLEKDPIWLADSDRKRIAQHFRSKVYEAKRKSELSGTPTFMEDIKLVLDYRDWYEFIIYYEKTGEKRKEMKKSNYNTFSGGERAMAMYTPLLAAVDARLQNAHCEAPRIFALDEAFAGVDDNNIREAFKVIEMYDFDYTLNSQSLWGCYEEVPDLSIYVLSRMGNSNLVNSTAYSWNGIKQTRVEEPYEISEDIQSSFVQNTLF